MMAGKSVLDKQALFIGIEALNGGKCVNSSHHAKLRDVRRQQMICEENKTEDIEKLIQVNRNGKIQTSLD